MLPEDHPVTWLRHGNGLVGCGVAAEIRTSGAGRFEQANQWWRDLTARAIVRSDVDEPGSGLVAFGTFAFADEPGDSALIVPEVILGRRGDTAWLTTVSSVGGLDQLDRRLELATSPRAPGRRQLHRRRNERRAVDGPGRRGGGPDQRRRPREGGAGPRPGRHRRRADRRALAAAQARRAVPHLLDLPRRRDLRRHAGAVRAPRARPGHLAGAGRHHPAYRRRRPRPQPSPPGWPGRRRTSRSTSTPSARSPSRWRRTARR